VLGVAAAGMYTIYVVLTCAFYYVGLAYANVSEATLFVLFIGLLDSVLYLGRQAYARFSGGVLLPAAVGHDSHDRVPSGA